MPRTDRPDSPSPSAPWAWWAAYAGLVLGGLCFGVWAGTQKPERVVEVAATPTPGPAAPPPAKPDPKPEPPADTPAPKATPPAPAAKADPKPEPKKTTPDPKPPVKPPEPKKTEPPKTEPKKPDPKAAAPAVTFAKDVRPVFQAHCLSCHGNVGQPKGGLDLRTLAAAVKGGDSGPGVKPNDPDGSPVWQQINDGTMPPAGKPRMSDKEKQLVRAWIEAGAK